jgi:hypothetical protein
MGRRAAITAGADPLIFGDRDFSPLPDAVEMFELLPNAQLAVLPGTTHVGVTRRPGEVLALITPFGLIGMHLECEFEMESSRIRNDAQSGSRQDRTEWQIEWQTVLARARPALASAAAC